MTKRARLVTSNVTEICGPSLAPASRADALGAYVIVFTHTNTKGDPLRPIPLVCLGLILSLHPLSATTIGKCTGEMEGMAI